MSTVICSLVLVVVAASSSHAGAAAASPVDRLRTYLRIRTDHPSPDYAATVAFLLNISSELGLYAAVFNPTPGKPLLLLSWPGSDPTLPSVLLNSHLDSVPAEASNWLHPPFDAHLDPSSGRIYARGAQDDKCISIQYLEAIRNLRANGFIPHRSLHLSFVPDEEIGGADGMQWFVKSEEFRKLNVGFALDEGQASPRDEFRVFFADRRPWRLVVTASGVPGHGAVLYEGAAVQNLMDCVEVAMRFRESQFDLVKTGARAPAEVVSLNIVYMKAGTQSPKGFVMNVQPSKAEVGFDIRVPPTVDPEFLRKRIAGEWAPASKNMTFKLTEHGPAWDYAGRPLITSTDETNLWWSVFKQAINTAGGKLAKPEILGSTSDGRFLRERGIPVLGFSPMANTPILLHDHNEFLEDMVFLNGIKVYEHLISTLSSVPGDFK